MVQEQRLDLNFRANYTILVVDSQQLVVAARLVVVAAEVPRCPGVIRVVDVVEREYVWVLPEQKAANDSALTVVDIGDSNLRYVAQCCGDL